MQVNFLGVTAKTEANPDRPMLKNNGNNQADVIVLSFGHKITKPSAGSLRKTDYSIPG